MNKARYHPQNTDSDCLHDALRNYLPDIGIKPSDVLNGIDAQYAGIRNEEAIIRATRSGSDCGDRESDT
ncbi:hypothetical protein [Burkholderia sp. BCC1998]|uniref:hypothetical protein n=1 Tax=Burkholderia sp. BCC1998 TaxID=2817447 RepID=UPI002AB69790|nr:hypothetical protein [Burkholderia sp. BCC1998]